jgi:hypothetical protein
MSFLLETGATKMTARGIWTRLEKEMAVGDTWQFDDGECCTVAALTHNGIEPAVLCTSGISYPNWMQKRSNEAFNRGARHFAIR